MDEQVQAHFNKILKHPKATEILSSLVDALTAVESLASASEIQMRRQLQTKVLNARGRLEEATGIADVRRERLVVASTHGQMIPGEKAEPTLIRKIYSPDVLRSEIGQISLRFAMAQFFYDEKHLIDKMPISETDADWDFSGSFSSLCTAHFIDAAKGYKSFLSHPKNKEDNSYLSPVDRQGKIEESGPANALRIRTVTRLGYTCGFINSADKPRSVLEIAADYFNSEAKKLDEHGFKIKPATWTTVRQWAKSSAEKRHADLKNVYRNAFNKGRTDAVMTTKPNSDLFFSGVIGKR
jgi:hypothetical protein